jgi:ankyrin repeat protein
MMRAMAGEADIWTMISGGDEAGALRTIEADPSLAATRHASGASVVLWAMYHRRRPLAEKVAALRGELDVFEAAALGDKARLAPLVKADPSLVNATATDGFSPLGLACFFGAEDTAALLIANGAEIDRPSANPMRVAPLHSAVSAKQADIVRRLLDAGAAASPRQQGGWTPLHSAAHSGDQAMVELLLDNGAERAARSDDGKSPADMAAAAGHVEIASLLRI